MGLRRLTAEGIASRIAGGEVDTLSFSGWRIHTASARACRDVWNAPGVWIDRDYVVKYLNNRLEADHGALKRVIKPGFKTIPTASATIKGFEVMRWPNAHLLQADLDDDQAIMKRRPLVFRQNADANIP